MIEGLRIDLKTFLGLTNALKLSESKYQGGFGMIIWGQNPLTFMIPMYDDSFKNLPASAKIGHVSTQNLTTFQYLFANIFSFHNTN